MRQRYIGGLPCLDGKRHPDDARDHVIQAGGLGVEGKLPGPLEACQPVIQLRLFQYRLIADIGSVGRVHRTGLSCIAAHFIQPAFEIELPVQFAQPLRILRLTAQLQRPDIQLDVAADGGQFTRQW